MNTKKQVIYSIIGGLVISLMTGLIPSPNALLGANLYGLPFAWLSQMVLAPNVPAPLSIIWFSLMMNTIIWSVVTYIGLELFEKTTAKKEEHHKSKGRK